MYGYSNILLTYIIKVIHIVQSFKKSEISIFLEFFFTP